MGYRNEMKEDFKLKRQSDYYFDFNTGELTSEIPQRTTNKRKENVMKEFAIELGKIAASVLVATLIIGILLPTAFTIGVCVAEQVRDILPAKVSVEKGLNE